MATVNLTVPDSLTLTATAGSSTGTSGTITVDAITTTSGNWSGYASSAGLGTVTAVGGTWVQPAVTGSTGSTTSMWVGIDGLGNGTVEQCGVAATPGSTPEYVPWFEFWGDQVPSTLVPNPNPQGKYYNQTNLPSSDVVNPGDTISAAVSFVPGGLSRTFLFQMTDTPAGGGAGWAWSATKTMSYVTPQRATADWIVENPNNATQPLANFGQLTFTGAWATVNSTSLPINQQPNVQAINMVDAAGNLMDTTSNPPVIANSLGYNEPASGRQSSSFTVSFLSSNGASFGREPYALQPQRSAPFAFLGQITVPDQPQDETAPVQPSLVPVIAQIGAGSSSRRPADRIHIRDRREPRIAAARIGLSESHSRWLDGAEVGRTGGEDGLPLKSANLSIDPLAPNSSHRSHGRTVTLTNPSASSHTVSRAGELFTRSLAFHRLRTA
jgi:hypothetical protein